MNKEILVVDRIEGEYILVESSSLSIIKINKNYVDYNVKEGDILVKKGDKYIVDKDATDKRKKGIENLIKGLWQE